MAELPSIVPSIAIELDRVRHLRFDRAAVFACEVELRRVWGREMTFFEALRNLALVLVDGDLSHLSLHNISVLLWCGCRHEDPMLTLAQVQEVLPYTDPQALLPYVARIMEAWQAQTPTPTPAESNGEDRSDPLAGSPGSSSGVSSAFASA